MAEETGKVEETVLLKEDAVEIKDFKGFIFKRYGLGEDDTIRIAVNHALKDDGRILPGDEIAFLPPYAGG